jgi:hypothetical protein
MHLLQEPKMAYKNAYRNCSTDVHVTSARKAYSLIYELFWNSESMVDITMVCQCYIEA